MPAILSGPQCVYHMCVLPAPTLTTARCPFCVATCKAQHPWFSWRLISASRDNSNRTTSAWPSCKTSLQWRHMSVMASRVNGNLIVSPISSGQQQRKHQSSTFPDLLYGEFRSWLSWQRVSNAESYIPYHDVIIKMFKTNLGAFSIYRCRVTDICIRFPIAKIRRSWHHLILSPHTWKDSLYTETGPWAPSQYKDRLIYVWRFPC